MKAVIVGAQRTGGSFLATCLSNHHDIYCTREEPFRKQAIWQRKLKLSHAALLDFVLSAPYYAVSACRLTYDQALHPELTNYLVKNKVRIIHLTRDVLPTVTSVLLAKQEIARNQPRHVFADGFLDTERLDCGPDVVLARIKHQLLQQARFARDYGGAPLLHVTYAAITGATEAQYLHPRAGREICNFLEVVYTVMVAHNRRLHQRPLPDYYTRWPEIHAALAQTYPEVLHGIV